MQSWAGWEHNRPGRDGLHRLATEVAGRHPGLRAGSAVPSRLGGWQERRAHCHLKGGLNSCGHLNKMALVPRSSDQ
jgi:hypothetical protein